MGQDQYKELFERSADAILIIQGDRFVDCNAATVRMLGYKDKKELLDTHPSQLSPEKQSDGRRSFEKANEMIRLAFEKGSIRFEWDHKKADGMVFPVEVLLTAILGKDPPTLHVVWRDISQRRQHEKELLRLKSIIESTSDIVSSATPEGKIFYVNAAGIQRLASGNPGRSLDEIRHIHPAWAYDKIMGEGIPKAIANGIWHGETAVLDASGQEIVVSQVIMAHRDASGEVEYLSTIIRDISEQKRAERFLNDIIDNIPICVKLVKRDGTLIRMNPAGLSMLGAGPGDNPLGNDIYDFVAEGDRESFIRFNEKVCSGKRGSLNFAVNTLDKRVLHMDSIAVPLALGPDNEIVQLGITRDITEQVRNRAERQELLARLHQSQKMEAIGTLAGGIAHDFNNILSGIFGYGQLAKNHIHDPQKATRYMDDLLSCAGKAAELIQQILTFSRKSARDKKPLRIYIVLKETLKLLRASIPTTIGMQEEILSRAKVMADATNIQQVVMNLCTNAYHAMGEGGGTMTVRLTDIRILPDSDTALATGLTGNHVRLEVQDTGRGMAPDILAKIFEPYFTTKETEKGTGLGLAVVHGIVKEHQGAITVESRPGKGTCFTVYLPVTEESDKGLAARQEQGGVLKGNASILLVDDEQSILDAFSGLLTFHGYRVASFSDGAAAFEAFIKEPERFDLILSDLTMPGLTGEQFAKKVLALKAGMPIILCSGKEMPESRVNSIGIRQFLLKPVVPDKLLMVIQEILGPDHPVS